MSRVLRSCVAGGAIILSSAVWSITYGQGQSAALATTRSFTHPRLGITVIATDIDLPAGAWTVASASPASALGQVHLMPELPPEIPAGRRAAAAYLEQMTEMSQFQLQELYGPIARYASTHGGVGPKAITDLDRQLGPMLEALMRSPWPEDANNPKAGPYLFLAPGTRLTTPGGQPSPRIPLVVELRPYLADGRHWVLFSDGRPERVPVDRAWLAKFKLTVRPVLSAAVSGGAAAPTTVVRHTLFALRGAAAPSTAVVTLINAETSERRDVRWALAGGRTDPTVLGVWAAARVNDWLPLTTHGHAPILQAWINRSSALYGQSPAFGRDQFATLPDGSAMGAPANTTSVFDLLGGRAALRETLQLELIRAREASPFRAGAAAIPTATLESVDVKPLPFETMLAGRPGGSIALADHVPEDRLFVYFAKPAAVFPFLTQGGDFLGRTGSAMTATAFDDNLKARYLRRLGLPEASSRKFLESGAITEVAVVASDLFFLEGTDLTVLMRARAPDAVSVALGMIGIQVAAQGITERRTADGRTAYWARQDDVLCLSTSRRELERVLRQRSTPASSLGQSAELRYMLTEVPVRPETRAFVYLSDPFIRRMVGAALKIGQLRRMRAAADMTLITAGALLRQLDGGAGAADVARLIELGYVPRGIDSSKYALGPDLTVVSPTWGTLADLTPIDTDTVAFVTADEATAYTTYMQEYKDYWRQFFDPIALRLDDTADGALEMTTFILPLVDSQLYAQLRGVIETREQGKPLRVPRMSPAPVFQLSLNLSEASWVRGSAGWSDSFSRYTGISSELFDLLGPGLHIAVQDADPVISLGTADLLGAFGGATTGARLDLLTPFALSVLTRPCKIFIELQDEPRAIALLRRAASTTGYRNRRGDPEFGFLFRQVEGRDAWMYTLGIPGMATVRLGLEVQQGYLVMSNIPWSQPITVDRVESRPQNGAAISVMPEAVRQGLAALFATQAEHDQMAALSSMASLLPLLQTIAATPEEAATRHTALFGSTPLHPGTGAWLWRDGRLESSRYGSATQWKVPAFVPDAGFGLLDGATLLDLNMQFESGGLRATGRWIWK